ncbi:hypothetical protein Tco_1530015, partial [Tanacetum coccineum]
MPSSYLLEPCIQSLAAATCRLAIGQPPVKQSTSYTCKTIISGGVAAMWQHPIGQPANDITIEVHYHVSGHISVWVLCQPMWHCHISRL